MTRGYATYGDDPDFEAEYGPSPELGDLFTAVDSLRADFTRLTERVDRGGTSRLDLLSRQLERLQQQVRALERAVRVADGVPQADLDDVGADVRTLAVAAARWDDLHRELVTKEERARHERELRDLEQVREAHVRCDTDLLAVITTLTTAGRGARGTAESELHALTARRRTLLEEELPAAEHAAERATAALREADEIAARVLPQLDRAERAWDDLQQRLRARITEALGSAALLPPWFGQALGTAPPTGTSGDDWIRTAASILAYRVTFAIADPALPLGLPPTPSDDQTHRRWTWRAQLESEVDELNR